MARSSLAGGWVKADTLIAPFATRIVSPSSYFLVYPQASAQKVGFKLFRAWLLEQLGETTP